MIGVTYVGTDGSTWDLVNGPVGLTAAGLEGFGKVKPEEQLSASPYRHGQRLTGWRLPEREVWLPLRFRREAAVDVIGLQRAWWRANRTEGEGRLTVNDGHGGERGLTVRVRHDGSPQYPIDPSIWTPAFGMTYVADQPWWEGAERTFSFQIADAGIDFFNGIDKAPNFNIIAGGGGDADTLSNDGDAPAWPVITVSQGEATSYSVTLDGHTVGGDLLVDDGQTLTIETEPSRQVAWLDGENVTRELTDIDFAPVPPGAEVPVSITVEGDAVLAISIRPLYERAF